MKKKSNLLQNKISITGFFLLGAMIFTNYKIQENSARLKKLVNFESGMQTCFSRVNQTYTAKMLTETSSNYLTQNFQNLTEECFAESILNMEDGFKIELSAITKKLSTLASNVHWFHEDLLSPKSNNTMATTGESRDVGNRFEKIESTKDEILGSTDTHKNEIYENLNQEKTLFYVFGSLLIIMMFSEYMRNARRQFSNLVCENDAQAELLDNNGEGSVRVGEIIKTALEQNDLMNCSSLFCNFHAQETLSKNFSKKNDFSLESFVALPAHPAVVPEQVNKKQNDRIDKIWNDDSLALSADNENMRIEIEQSLLISMNLEKVSSGIIDLLADKLFSQGIQMDVKIPDDLMIKGRPEELEQTLYHLINYAINSTHVVTGDRSISIFAHRLGDVVALDLIHSGLGFNDIVLKQKAGVANTSKSLDIDLQICQTLLEGIEAKMQLDNKMNQTGDITGARVKMIFKSGANEARLVDLKVGSKKEILATINSAIASAS